MPVSSLSLQVSLHTFCGALLRLSFMRLYLVYASCAYAPVLLLLAPSLLPDVRLWQV